MGYMMRGLSIRWRDTLSVFAITCLIFLGGRVQAGQNPDRNQADFTDLNPALQYRISQDQGRDNPVYHFEKQGNSFKARNKHQGIDGVISPEVFRIVSGGNDWNLSLVSVGRGDCRQNPKSSWKADFAQNRLEYSQGMISQWYRNGPFGLQQGWTITRPPRGACSQDLTLALVQRGTLRARPLAGSRRAVGLYDASDNLLLSYGGLNARDAGGRELQAWFELEGNRLLVKVKDRGACYPLVVDPWVQRAKLTASDAEDSDQLGRSVAISADGSTVAAGANGDDLDRGAVYVYERPVAGWADATQDAKLTASDTANSDFLGCAVAVSSDGSVVAAGAERKNITSNDNGAVYVYKRPGAGWDDATQTARITASDAAPNNYLGFSVAITADGSTVASGAYGVNGGGDFRGAVYVFKRVPLSSSINMLLLLGN